MNNVIVNKLTLGYCVTSFYKNRTCLGPFWYEDQTFSTVYPTSA